jgi:7-cyano-7-deazaguanine synthase
VGLLYPFARMNKLEVVKLGMNLQVPFEKTWSCYVGGDEPCGECLACRERREALFLAGALA